MIHKFILWLTEGNMPWRSLVAMEIIGFNTLPKPMFPWHLFWKILSQIIPSPSWNHSSKLVRSLAINVMQCNDSLPKCCLQINNLNREIEWPDTTVFSSDYLCYFVPDVNAKCRNFAIFIWWMSVYPFHYLKYFLLFYREKDYVSERRDVSTKTT